MSLVFGYGSLVLKASRPKNIKEAKKASLPGWQREWAYCINRGAIHINDLTISRKSSSTIEGILLDVNENMLHRLDRREDGYREQKVKLSDGTEAITYVGDKAYHKEANKTCPVWRSYIDAVVLGYYELGGTPSVRKLIETTKSWDIPVIDDKSKPSYLKAATLTKDQQELAERLLKQLGVWNKIKFLS